MTCRGPRGQDSPGHLVLSPGRRGSGRRGRGSGPAPAQLTACTSGFLSLKWAHCSCPARPPGHTNNKKDFGASCSRSTQRHVVPGPLDPPRTPGGQLLSVHPEVLWLRGSQGWRPSLCLSAERAPGRQPGCPCPVPALGGISKISVPFDVPMVLGLVQISWPAWRVQDSTPMTLAPFWAWSLPGPPQIHSPAWPCFQRQASPPRFPATPGQPCQPH